MIPALLRKMHAANISGAHEVGLSGIGTPRRELLHSDDLADACVFLLSPQPGSFDPLGPVVNAIIQLGSVPLLLHAWGAPKYGDWLLLYAIPSYRGLSDLGFGDASGSDMFVRVAANDRECCPQAEPRGDARMHGQVTRIHG